MNETNLIIQNRLREATVSLERANLIICDETWKCDSSVPPFSSIQLVLQGEGTVCIDETTIHPTGGQLYLLPAYTNQAFFTDIQNPYRTYYCHFEITCQQTGDDVEIGFNSRYMLDALKASECDEIQLLINGALSPIKLVPLEGDSFTFLVLPVRLKSE